MSAPSEKPSALIFGGLNTWSRNLATFLVPLEGEPLVSHLRIVDKFSVNPPTTYLGTEFPKILKKEGVVEYKQANLTVPAAVSKAFDPPEGQPAYSYVFDLSGEVLHDRSDKVYFQNTTNVARLLGQEAARRNVKAYVRIQQPFYETPEKGSHDEKESIKPVGVRGVWWHESIRVLAAISDLNLVILRTGLVYGPYVTYGVIPTTLTVAAVYGYLKKPMKGLWSPGKNPMNTVHVSDVAAAGWMCAEWMGSLGRKEADSLAGEDIVPNDKSKVKEGTDLPDRDTKLVAPLFNLVDDSNSTLISIGNEVTALFGTTFGFHDFIKTTIAKVKLTESMIEEINDEHVGAWTDMTSKAVPPVNNTPLSAYMDESILSKMVIGFSANKIKNVLGYNLKHPRFDQTTLQELVDKWKEEGNWPNVQSD